MDACLGCMNGDRLDKGWWLTCITATPPSVMHRSPFSSWLWFHNSFSFVCASSSLLCSVLSISHNVMCANFFFFFFFFFFRVGKPPGGLHLDVYKGDQLIQVCISLSLYVSLSLIFRQLVLPSPRSCSHAHLLIATASFSAYCSSGSVSLPLPYSVNPLSTDLTPVQCFSFIYPKT